MQIIKSFSSVMGLVHRTKQSGIYWSKVGHIYGDWNKIHISENLIKADIPITIQVSPCLLQPLLIIFKCLSSLVQLFCKHVHSQC